LRGLLRALHSDKFCGGYGSIRKKYEVDEMTTNVKKVLHAGISVYNMEESLAWYKKNLGFEVVKNDGYVPPLKAKIVFIEKDGFQIELFEYDEPKKIPEDRLTPNTDLQTVGTKHIAFATDDMDALKAGFVENGVDIAHEVRMDGEAVMFVRDCNGVLLEFIQGK
jgi:catechol 2,3-dioxygenase-like lactoylglutathione lyase family enzyme